MPVTCTETPKVLRVDYIAYQDDSIRREAVCFMQPTGNGQIDILYSHHIDYHKPSESGPWEKRQEFKMPLSPTLVSEITSRVLYEFWNAFGLNVRDLPRGTAKVPVPELLLEGGIKLGKY